jgi:hypothetical protein
VRKTVRGNPDKTKPYRWKKGCGSPNPGGRPKKTPFTDAHRQIAESSVKELTILDSDSVAVAIAKALAREALRGKIQAATEIANRVEGTSRQRLEVTGQDGNALQIEDVHERLMEKLLGEGSPRATLRPTRNFCLSKSDYNR